MRSKKDPRYTESNVRRCDEENDRVETRSKSLFSCCSKNSTALEDTSSNFDPNKFDYIVEKLVVKRVPIGLFATPYDVYEDAIEGCHIERKPLVVSDPQTIYNIVPAVNSSLFYTNTNDAGVSGFSTRASSKNLRFTNDVFGETDSISVAATSGYRADVERRYRETESLNRFTSLHPNLKESERPPKDPCPLNMTKSRRSLAEEISEIAAKKETDLHHERTRNEILTTGNIYTAQAGPSRELTTKTKALPVVEEIPARRKSEDERSTSNRQRTGNSSCFPFGWMSADNRATDESSISRTEDSLDDDVGDSSGPPKRQNFTVAPVQVHYSSPNLENIRKIVREDRCCLDSINRNNFDTEDLETKNDDSRISPGDTQIDEFGETTLRWKIIIKHHPPGSPESLKISRGSNSSKIPTLSQTLRNVIEAKVHKQPSCNNE